MTQVFFGILLCLIGLTTVIVGVIKIVDANTNGSLIDNKYLPSEEAIGYFGYWGVGTQTVKLITNHKTIEEVYPIDYTNLDAAEKNHIDKAEMIAEKYGIPLSQNWKKTLNGD